MSLRFPATDQSLAAVFFRNHWGWHWGWHTNTKAAKYTSPNLFHLLTHGVRCLLMSNSPLYMARCSRRCLLTRTLLLHSCNKAESSHTRLHRNHIRNLFGRKNMQSGKHYITRTELRLLYSFMRASLRSGKICAASTIVFNRFSIGLSDIKNGWGKPHTAATKRVTRASSSEYFNNKVQIYKGQTLYEHIVCKRHANRSSFIFPNDHASDLVVDNLVFALLNVSFFHVVPESLRVFVLPEALQEFVEFHVVFGLLAFLNLVHRRFSIINRDGSRVVGIHMLLNNIRKVVSIHVGS